LSFAPGHFAVIRRKRESAMPKDLIQKMTRRDLRDLVEYLAGL
jgi:hypothetical protein